MLNLDALQAPPLPPLPESDADIVATLRQEVVRLRLRLAEAERLADSDLLTPLVNRRCLIREIDRAAAQVARHGTQAALLFADMNELKLINDRYGHAAGDAALMHVAHILLAETRASDLVGRIGGDEFGVLLVHADAAATERAAARIAAASTSRPFVYAGRTRSISLAIGASPIRADDTAAAVLARADAAMYAAKSAQRSER